MPTKQQPVHVVFLAYPEGEGWSCAEPSSPIVVTARLRVGGPGVDDGVASRIGELIRDVLGDSARDVLVDPSFEVGTRRPSDSSGGRREHRKQQPRR